MRNVASGGSLIGTCFCLQKMKGLIRKRSTTAARLQRALSSKAQRPGAGESPSDTTSGPQTPGNRDQGLPRSGQDKRQFLMEAPVQFTTVRTNCAGTRVSLVVKALGYKPEGREFEPRWDEIVNLPNPSGRTRPTQPLTEMSTGNIKKMFLGSKVRLVRGADNLTAIYEPTL
jgi:hypothetical protein